MNKITEKEIQKSLQENIQHPDLAWVKKTRENLSVFAHTSVTKQNKSRISLYTLFNFLSFSSMQSAYKKPLVLGITAAVIAAGGLVGAYIYTNNRNTTQSTQVFLSEAEQTEFLTNVIKNNPRQALARANLESQSLANQAGGAGSQDNKLMAEGAPSTSDMRILPYPYVPEFKYRYSKTDVTFGNAYSSCNAISSYDAYLGQGLVSESFEYYDGSGSSSNKWVTMTPSGTIVNYNVSNNTPTRSESYTYMGGSYAVKTTTLFANSNVTDMFPTGDVSIMPIEDAPVQESIEEVSPTDLISQYFGPDAKVIERVTRDGKDLYVVEYSYKLDCDQDVSRMYMSSYPYQSPENLPDTMIMRDLVEVDNFQVYENTSYLNSVSDSNLLSRTKVTVVNNNDSFDSVANNFVFDINVPVREETFDWSVEQPAYDYRAEANAIADYLIANPIDLLYVNGANLSGVYSAKAYEQINTNRMPDTVNYYADRAFYPAGELGDKLFESYNRIPETKFNYIPEIASVSFSGDSSYFNISVFSKSDATLAQIREQTNGFASSDPNASSTTQQVNVSIDNQIFSATLDSTTYNYAVDPAVTYESTPAGDDMLTIAPAPEGGNYVSRTLFVEKDNLIYSMWLDDSQYNMIMNGTLTFSTRNPAQNADQFRAELLAAYELMYNSPITIEPLPADAGVAQPR